MITKFFLHIYSYSFYQIFIFFFTIIILNNILHIKMYKSKTLNQLFDFLIFSDQIKPSFEA